MVDLILILATIPFPLPFMCIAHRPTMSLPDVTVASMIMTRSRMPKTSNCQIDTNFDSASRSRGPCVTSLESGANLTLAAQGLVLSAAELVTSSTRTLVPFRISRPLP